MSDRKRLTTPKSQPPRTKLVTTSQPSTSFPQWVLNYPDAGLNYSAIKATAESSKLCLLPYQIEQVSNTYLTNVDVLPSSPKIIVDATAHIGCDTLNFARIFPDATIIAIESNLETYRLLAENIHHYKYITGTTREGKIVPLYTDFMLLFPALSGDILYLDPPWGEDYESIVPFDLFISDVSISDIIIDALAKFTLVFLKAPHNFGYDVLRDKLPKTMFLSTDEVIKPGKESGLAYYIHSIYSIGESTEKTEETEKTEGAEDVEEIYV